MEDEDDTSPASAEDDWEDELEAPLVVPSRQVPILTPDGKQVQTKITKPRTPAPVFHDTSMEAHMDDDLSLINHGLKNVIEGWSAVRTIKENLDTFDRLYKGLEARRKLANKQLGHNAAVPMKGVIYHLDDD